jgi:hypothetical protein
MEAVSPAAPTFPLRARDDADVIVRIEAQRLPGARCGPGPDAPDGYTGLRVGVQRRNDPSEILDPVAGDAGEATWTLQCRVRETEQGPDLLGPYVQGRPQERFIYLSWLSDQGPGPRGMFRRAKLRLDQVPAQVMTEALATGVLRCRVDLTDEKGNPRCAALNPPAIAWTAG